jgi:hypothetical protein
MQSAGLGNPPGQDWGETSPSHLCALAATDKNAPPQPANATLKDAQLSRVPRNSMGLVVAQHNLAKPCTDRGRTMMLPALKLGLNGFELRDHSLLRRNPPDDESFVADALPTEVSEAQKCAQTSRQPRLSTDTHTRTQLIMACSSGVGLWEARRSSQGLPISAGMGCPPTANESCLKLALMWAQPRH